MFTEDPLPPNLATVIEQLPCGVVVLDADGRPVLCNAICRQILGHRLNPEQRASHQAALFAPRNAETGQPVDTERLLNEVLHNGRRIFHYECVIRPPTSDHDVWIWLDAVPLREADGSIAGLGVIVTDITYQRQLARELDEFARQNAFLHGVLAEREDRLRQLVTHWPSPASAPPSTDQPPSAIARLTDRERTVLSMLASGRDNGSIAQELHLSVNTVRQHVKHILAKLQVSNRTQAALLVTQLSDPRQPIHGLPSQN